MSPPNLFWQIGAFCHTGHNKIVNSCAGYWLERARRDLSNGGIYLEAQVSWRAQRENFACAGGAICSQRCQISVSGRPSSRLDDTWCPPIITEHFATISSGCGGARARSAVVTSSALLELPPGGLSAFLTAVTRLCTPDRASLMKWAQFPQKKGEAGRRRRPRS